MEKNKKIKYNPKELRCRKCKELMNIANVNIILAAHDNNLLDIYIICSECGYKINGFYNTKDMIEQEKIF